MRARADHPRGALIILPGRQGMAAECNRPELRAFPPDQRRCHRSREKKGAIILTHRRRERRSPKSRRRGIRREDGRGPTRLGPLRLERDAADRKVGSQKAFRKKRLTASGSGSRSRPHLDGTAQPGRRGRSSLVGALRDRTWQIAERFQPVERSRRRRAVERNCLTVNGMRDKSRTPPRRTASPAGG